MILISGGTGLLGSHLLLELVRKHKEVVALKRPTSNLSELRRVFAYYVGDKDELDKLWDRIRWVDADLMNQVDLETILQGGQQGEEKPVEQVYHCAGMVSFQPRDRGTMICFNSNSTASLVNACLAIGVQKMLHVSSTSAIGKPAEGSPATESLIWSHNKSSTGYAESKFLSEMEVWRGIEEGLNAVIVNPSIILGSGFWKRGSSAIFHRVAGGLKYAAPGITGFVGIQDVVASMIGLMNSDISGERFIISEGNYSYTEVFEKIGRALGNSHDLKLINPGLMRNLVRLDTFASVFRGGKRLITSENVRAAFGEVHFSSDKIKEALDFEFTPLDQVIEEVAGHYRKDH